MVPERSRIRLPAVNGRCALTAAVEFHGFDRAPVPFDFALQST
jgi:hypothetical protein